MAQQQHQSGSTSRFGSWYVSSSRGPTLPAASSGRYSTPAAVAASKIRTTTKGRRSGRYSSNRQQQRESFRAGALTSYAALVARGDNTKEVLLRRQDANLEKILCDILKEELKQKLASFHYDAMNTWVLFTPIMGVTLLSASICILNTSSVFDGAMTNKVFGIVVSILQLILSVLQSLSKQLNLSAKASHHQSCAQSMKNIRSRAEYARLEDRYESIHHALKHDTKLTVGKNIAVDIARAAVKQPLVASTVTAAAGGENNNGGKPDAKDATSGEDLPSLNEDNVFYDAERGDDDRSEDDDDESDVPEREEVSRGADTLTKQYMQAMEQDVSFVPSPIASAFDVLDTRIQVINQSLLTNRTESLVAWQHILPAIYYQLYQTIIGYYGWPIFLPCPNKMVEECLKEFKLALNVEIDNNADLLMDILDRSNQIRCVQDRLTKKQSERNKRYMHHKSSTHTGLSSSPFFHYPTTLTADGSTALDDSHDDDNNDSSVIAPGTHALPSYGSIL